MPVDSRNSPVWTPRMTVSAVVEHHGRFLVVEEIIDGVAVMNQPAGHLEQGETLLDAVMREVLEETRRVFTPRFLTGLYRWQSPDDGPTFMRVNFCGDVGDEDPSLHRDADIAATHWLDRDALAQPDQCRSPLVLKCIDDYTAGRHIPLEMLHELD